MVLVALLAIALTGYLFYLYQESPADLNKSKPDGKMDATELSFEFSVNEAKASETYIGKIIETEGPVKEVDTASQTLVLGDSTFPLLISCALAPSQHRQLNKVQPTGRVRIRGTCTGVLMDIQLNNAVLVENN